MSRSVEHLRKTTHDGPGLQLTLPFLLLALINVRIRDDKLDVVGLCKKRFVLTKVLSGLGLLSIGRGEDDRKAPGDSL